MPERRCSSIITSALLLFAILVLGACDGQDRPLTAAVRNELSRAVSLHVRISGAPLPGETADPSTLTRLAIEARQQLLAERSVDALHASALIDIATAGAEYRPLDRAIALLEEASAHDSLNPALPNDIAVAYLLRSDLRNSVIDLFQALASVERSIAVDSLFEEALFNRAVVLSRLALYNRAEVAWGDYARSSPERDWDRIAQNHRVRIDTTARTSRGEWESVWRQWQKSSEPSALKTARGLIPGAPQVAREFISIDVLGEWGRLLSAGRKEEAQKALHFAAELSGELARRSGDSIVHAAVARIQSANNPDVLRLASGHAAYAEGRNLYSAGKPDAAAGAFKQAITALRTARGGFAWYPALYDAAVDLFSGDYAASDRAARAYLRTTAAERSPVLAARANYLLGLGYSRRGRFEAALPYYEAAERLYLQAGETQHHTSMQALSAEALNVLGQDEAGLQRFVAVLTRLQREPVSTNLHNTLVVFGQAAGRAGFPHAMAAIHAEGLHVADRTGRISDPIEARMEVARAELLLGRRAAAIKHITDARSRFATIPDSTLRQRVKADLAFAEGLAAIETDARFAIRRFTVSLDHFRRQKTSVNLIRALTARSDAYTRVGDAKGASTDLAEAVSMIERDSRSTMNLQLRASFHEASVRAYDQLIGMHFARGATDSAFQYLERSRLQLADHVRSGTAAPTLGTVGNRLPPGVLLIEYAVLDDRLLIWAISRDTIRTHSANITKSDVAALVERFVRLARTKTDSIAFANSGRALRALLLDPIGPALANFDQLLIVPDHSLHAVPFALLPGHSADRYLVEDHTLRMIPGAAYVQSRAQPSFSSTSTILLAGDVAGRGSFPEMPGLASAGRELDGIARLYEKPMRLHGERATRSAFIAYLPQFDIVHFAGHARFMSDQPDRSFLVLSPEAAGEGGLVFAHELARTSLHPRSLVILSACSSGTRPPSRTGGLSGLAQAFMTAGASGVVGSLWEVEDAGTARLLVEFHRALVSGVAPAEALRTAQRTLIRDHADPAVWGAFRYEGL